MEKILLLLLLVLSCNSELFATTPVDPYSYKKEVGNGKYVFVMRAENSDPLFSSTGKQYASSGLYLNDGNNVPLWSVDWYSAVTYVSSDGKHLARMEGPWPDLKFGEEPDLRQVALAFYEDGKLIRQYFIADLIDDPRSVRRPIGYLVWQRSILFEDALDRLILTTEEDKIYIFDVKSGELVEE